MKKVLIVDDEQSILTLLTFNLEKEGYQVQTALDGLIGYNLALANEYDFILLDLMMPSMDGMEVCKKLRQEKNDTPIMILTAKDDELDKIIGLELGADDYMTKPFSPREVLARMKAIMRRIQPEIAIDKSKNKEKEDNNEKIIIGEICIFPSQYKVIVREKEIELTPKEFELLLYMSKRLNRVLSREQLLNAIWNFDYIGETRIVDAHISHIREKIELDTKKPNYIRTVRGFGYKFEVPKR
ncbi:two-component system, OmpR family, alkaline phosphatase synthesis response regulator PhoP [Carnobacterium iners]|uniref:Two-component system, OmpR family, alkaline phosphatase synthesis response regulator PhoP n=1 Tax=Carnobacterium iners TaxID=1073423 RepID=A0A1X7MQD4_9LACT|nr:response regulator transcription factor [Carnobacterium iners]SEK87223.1 two-component system, OmpR family, alkaline phosphatase synthesis response regulator PhoP [Carnobacterium iners]SMH26885.1 two-component system, OmpR family, alkaline phosphatase synthesis response regulator PhoP [Carnobacterium iners]